MRQSPFNVCGVRRISSETCSLCELVSCETLSTVVRDIAVLISELLSICVAHLCKCCLFVLLICASAVFSCYTHFLFSGIFWNKESFSVILLVGLFSP
ncbi:hypothetical protein AVEN_73005-1 [Araneus ventricosus]|uniref:Uncharacterized protein n=1 Tax=Araneus ventricosus TaxID=182803 RepID=A0A4Y2MD91_ARAVE|nr:hypothetical protein AVEN_73005-1 [Araneus ventricosus]